MIQTRGTKAAGQGACRPTSSEWGVVMTGCFLLCHAQMSTCCSPDSTVLLITAAAQPCSLSSPPQGVRLLCSILLYVRCRDNKPCMDDAVWWAFAGREGCMASLLQENAEPSPSGLKAADLRILTEIITVAHQRAIANRLNLQV